MHITFLQYFIWIAISVADIVLLAITLRRKLWRRFPFFIGYTAFDLLRELIYWPALQQSAATYFYIYWSLSLLGSLLHLAIVFELGWQIFRPIEFIPKSSLIFGAICCATLLVAALVWSMGIPLPVARRLPLNVTRLNLVLTCVRFAMFAFVAAFSRYLGLHWRHYVFGILCGLGIYSSVDLVCTAIHAQFGADGIVALQLSKFSYLLAMAAWCFILAQPEPRRVAITPEIRELLRNARNKLQRYQEILGARQ